MPIAHSFPLSHPLDVSVADVLDLNVTLTPLNVPNVLPLSVISTCTAPPMASDALDEHPTNSAFAKLIPFPLVPSSVTSNTAPLPVVRMIDVNVFFVDPLALITKLAAVGLGLMSGLLDDIVM